MTKKTSIPRGKYYAPKKTATLSLAHKAFKLNKKPDLLWTTKEIWELYEQLLKPSKNAKRTTRRKPILNT